MNETDMNIGEVLKSAKFWNEKALAAYSNRKPYHVAKIYTARYQFYLALYKTLYAQYLIERKNARIQE